MTANGHNLPAGWATALAADVCVKIQDGTHFSPKVQLSEGKYRYVTAKNVRPGGLDLSDITYLREDDHREIYARCDTRKRDVLLVKDGVNAGDAALNTVDDEISLLSSVCFLRPEAGLITPEFMRYYLQSPKASRVLTGSLTGTAIRRIVLHRVKELPVLVAPLPEQHRIVEAIESHFSRLDEAVRLLERVKRNLKRYRASVLKAAVEGRLVPTEAALARAEGRSYEPARVLLERILAERRRRWQAEGSRGRYKEPVAPDTANLPPLPEGWCWASLDSLTCKIVDGTHHSPPYVDDGVAFLSVKDIRDGRVDFSECRFIPESVHRELVRRCHPEQGDLLVTKSGTIGRTAVVASDRAFSLFVSVALLKPVSQGACGRWLEVAFQHWLSTKNVAQDVKGSAIKNLHLEDFREVVVALPPAAEQKRVLTESDRVESIIEISGALVERGLARALRLRQSILKWAFEGKLVDQDPSDEPAAVLLARIRAERAVADSPRAGRRGRPKRRDVADAEKESR